MTNERDILIRLAANRRRRLERGRPRFGLTRQELEGSAHVAMRLAESSKSQVEAREREALASGV